MAWVQVVARCVRARASDMRRRLLIRGASAALARGCSESPGTCIESCFVSGPIGGDKAPITVALDRSSC